MLRKKTGSGFKPKAPVRRNVPATSANEPKQLSPPAGSQPRTPAPVAASSSVAPPTLNASDIPPPSLSAPTVSAGIPPAGPPTEPSAPVLIPSEVHVSPLTAPEQPQGIDTQSFSAGTRLPVTQRAPTDEAALIGDPQSLADASEGSTTGDRAPTSNANANLPAVTPELHVSAEKIPDQAPRDTRRPDTCALALDLETADKPQPTIEVGESPETESASSRKAKRSNQARKRSSAAQDLVDSSGTGPKRERTRKRRLEPSAGAEEGNSPAPESASVGRPRSRRTTTEDRTGDEGENADGVVQRKKRSARHRSLTPEDAEKMEVDIRQVKMGDLVKDLRIGKKFSRHDELLERERAKRQKNYVAKRMRETGLDGLADGKESRGSSATATPAPDQGKVAAAKDLPASSPAGGAAAPQFQIVDGQIVLNSGSLQYDRHAAAAQEAGEMEEEIEDEFTHHTTSSSYMKRQMKPNNWTPLETEKFYHALHMFGTDFQLISKMFPGKNRRHIKLKFNREERQRPLRITAALVGTKTVAMDLDEYKKHTGEEYETVDAITAEQRRAEELFEAEQRRVDEEAAEEARRKREELYGKSGGANEDGDDAATEGTDSKGKGRGRGRRKRAAVTGA
ncbi:hypothetical protein VTK73DRAFT_7471 [Phialemonium thermophilum]|uniref:Myb-like domain-containing protein n=1 Tax=Phialemonium thermophilum TaxID=223376 RepID=A0ABR3XTA3_9PEZI